MGKISREDGYITNDDIPGEIKRATSAPPAPPPHGLTKGNHFHALLDMARIEGYLDCMDGLVQDGYPDPLFIEYLCERVGRPVPDPFFDRIMDENMRLRRMLIDAQHLP